ncbi:nitrogenase iron-molybdenum cofactor biosynthesis protein NifE [Rhodopila globiformis]|uniref:Nitrogenase iron-molybdenum cofactor biosynthesis protein NifE n=1 Tax=Rhodopila globiformis TaxID=1071 RepID=A0A2S6NKE0_RHOGL|nr:nitrogenase iron-molybdenum cofactor biosynthesis protein NifE [Rhodopila globiformis]PPQ35496.1 nitrogenase iron-molybdenum cofactor biosynthesis protein NifE [Rhodopila globiformis]
MSEALKARIADVFNEPSCDKNQAKDATERKKGCSKPLVPGAAAGGCAFDGAMIALQPLTDVVHLVHGPLACAGNGWDGRHSASSGSRLFRTGFTTDMSEMDIVMGNGEKRLYRAIREAIARHNPPAVFVYATCVPAIIGDDIDAVCKHATEKLGTPCIPINAPGFAGSKNLGNKLGGEALFEHVIGTIEPEVVTGADINVLGEYNLSGEFWQVRPLLDRLGIRVHACITGDAKYRDVASCHRVGLNMMVCSTALINVARKMQEKYGVPYFEGSFYGIGDTSESLRMIARILVRRGVDASLIDRTEALIATEEARAWARIEPYRAALQGKKVLLYTGGVKSWSIVAALQEIGMEIVRTSVRKSTDEDKDRIKVLMGTDAHMVNTIPPREMYAMLKRGDADIMLSGGRSQFTALKAKTPWLDINQERHVAYAGYDGMVTLVAELHRSLTNPVWQELRRPAPWEVTDREAERTALLESAC